MVLLSIFAIVVLCNCGYYLLFAKFSFVESPVAKKNTSIPISVLVCAKNEAENLEKNIPVLLAQSYPNFELILINDASKDNTLEIMERFAAQDGRVHTVNVENNEAFWGNKKYALTLGIKRAINKHMLFTDADCVPSSDRWIQEMANQFTEEKQLILGYGAYQKRKGFLNKIIRFETLMTALQYFSYALAKKPYMGVGRNLGYTSSLYYGQKGFMNHMRIASGDDDLFVNEAATRDNVAICFSEDSFTYSKPKERFSEWFLQKRRHLTTAKFYKPKHQYLLGGYYLVVFLFWLGALSIPFIVDWKLPIALIILRFLLQYIFVGFAAKNLKEQSLIPFIPFYELFLVCAQLAIFISNSISKPSRWK